MDEGGKNIADKTDEMMSEAVSNIPEELRKRRSTRAVQAVPLIVRGVDALGRAFIERTATLIINCHGCRYQSKHYVLKNMWVTLEIPHPESGQPPRVVRGRVAWIQRPRTVRQLFQVALELEAPGNVWGIAFPPSDWFAFPDSAQLPAEVTAENAQVAAQEHVPQAGEAGFRIPLSGAGVAETSEADNVRVFPSTTDLASQLTRLVAEARQQVQAAAQQAAQAVSTERRQAIDDFEHQLATARDELSRELSGAIEKIQQASESGRRAAQQGVTETLAPQLAELARGVTAEISAQRSEHARQLQGAVEALERALREAEETAARLAELVAQSETQVAGRTAAAIKQAQEAARQQEEALAAQRELLHASASEIQQQAASALASAQAVWQKHLSGELEAAQVRWQIAIDNAVAGAQAAIAGSLGEQSRAQLAQLREESGRLTAELRETAGETDQQLRALEQSIQAQSEQLQTALARATEKLQQLDSSAARIETLQQGAGDLQSELLNRHSEELKQRSDSLFEEVSARIRGAFEESTREAVARFSQHVESAVKPHVARAEETVERLAEGRSLVDAALTMQQDRIRKSTDEAFAEALANFRASLGSAEQSLQASTGTVAARSLAEFEEKVAGVKRLATEDLLKSAEWYEKKAQTQIHGFTEKAAEQAAMKLREKAAEVSSAFGTELDHSSRTFLHHTQTEMEEMVRDAFERSRALFSEATDTTSAAFIDEIQRRAREELDGFETEVQKSASACRSQLQAVQSEITQTLSAEQENFLRRFEASMRGLLEAGITEVQGRVQAGFEPLLTSWKSMADAHQAEMRDLYTRMAEQAAEQYRGRLDNVSKHWMLATVASLDQQSRQVLSGVSSAAESKMRETFTAVFADMGEALRDRLRQIAANIELPLPQKSSSPGPC